jgi:hypothetical protein
LQRYLRRLEPMARKGSACKPSIKIYRATSLLYCFEKCGISSLVHDRYLFLPHYPRELQGGLQTRNISSQTGIPAALCSHSTVVKHRHHIKETGEEVQGDRILTEPHSSVFRSRGLSVSGRFCVPALDQCSLSPTTKNSGTAY